MKARLPSDPQLTRLLQFPGCAQSPHRGLRSMCSSVPTLPFMSHRGCVVPVLLALSVPPFVCPGITSRLGSHLGGAEGGTLLAFSRAQACGPQLLLSYCASSHTPNPNPGAIGVHVSVVCVYMWREWILSTFRGKPFWEMVGSIGSLTATHSCRAERECQTQRSIFLNHEGVSGWLPKSLAAWRPLPGPAPPQPT